MGRPKETRVSVGIGLAVVIAIALCLAAVAAPSASARRGGGPVVVGHVPSPPELSVRAARSAAWAKVRGFRDASPRTIRVAFEECGRDGLEQVTCVFRARGRLPGSYACRLTVVVSGLHHPKAQLHASCRADTLHHLTFHKASTAIRAAARGLAGKPVVIVVAERLSGTKISAEVEWSGDCGGEFVAVLSASGGVVVTHGPTSCG
jgi:hypothetical protein